MPGLAGDAFIPDGYWIMAKHDPIDADARAAMRPPAANPPDLRPGRRGTPAASGRLAVVTRTKDRPVLLDRAVRDVLAQTFQDWTHVIVNDGGDQAVLEAVLEPYREAYAGRLAVVSHPASLGMEAASNAGVRASRSRYLVIHDDDDTWDPEFARVAVDFLENRELAAFRGVVTHTLRVRETLEGGAVRVLSSEPFNTWLENVTLYRMCGGNVFPPISFVFEREALEAVGFFREDLPVLGDWEFNLRFLSRFEIGLVPKPLAFYHHRPDVGQGVYGNTVHALDHRHKLYDALLRNELLRRDLEAGVVGLGHLVNASRSFENVHSQTTRVQQALDRLHGLIDRVAANRLVRLAVRLFRV